MAKKKKEGSLLSRLFGGKKKTTRKKKKKGDEFNVRSFLMTALVLITLAGISVGFFYMTRYVKDTATVQNEFEQNIIPHNKPDWFTGELTERLYAVVKSAMAASDSNEEIAENVRTALSANMEWLSDIEVRRTYKGVEVYARYRKPMAFVKVGRDRYCLEYFEGEDSQGNVFRELMPLRYADLPGLYLPEIVGFTGTASLEPGRKWREDSVEAGMQLVRALKQMDANRQAKGGRILLPEIESVDVSNFAGRSDSRRPHLVLNVKDGPPVNWGAEWGQGSNHFEADDITKLGKLYSTYEQNGTLKVDWKFIELRDLN